MALFLSSSGWASPAPAATTSPSGIGEKSLALFVALVLGIAAWPVLMAGPDDPAARGSAAQAPSDTATTPETLVAGYGGVTHTHSSDVRFTKPGVTDLTANRVDWIGRPFKSPIYYGLRGMHWPMSSRLGGMVDFTHAKAISVREQPVRFSGTRDGKPYDRTATIGDTFRHLEFSHGHNMLTLNGLMRLGRIGPSLQPYVGAGLGVSLPHTEVQFLDETKRTYEYQLTGGVGQVLGGIEIRLPRVSVLIEYKFSLAPYWVPLTAKDGAKGNAFVDWWGQLGRWWRSEAPEAGILTTTLATHQVIVAVGYRHAGAPAASR